MPNSGKAVGGPIRRTASQQFIDTRNAKVVYQFAIFLDASFADSTLHLRVLWRLHKSLLLAISPKSGMLVDFEHALVAAILVSIHVITPCRS